MYVVMDTCYGVNQLKFNNVQLLYKSDLSFVCPGKFVVDGGLLQVNIPLGLYDCFVSPDPTSTLMIHMSCMCCSVCQKVCIKSPCG